MRKSYGFTLAEVLITLVIIGVIAAMTIPTLMGSTNDQENRTALKKAISALNQAAALDYALYGNIFDDNDNGCIPTNCGGEEQPSCEGMAQKDIVSDCSGGQGRIHELLNRHLSVISNEDNEITTADGVVFVPDNASHIVIKPRGNNNAFEVGVHYDGNAKAFLPDDDDIRTMLYE